MRALREPDLDSPPLVRYGLPEYVLGASPAAGADFTQAVDGNFFARLISVHARLVTDANAANRTVCVEYRDGNGNRYMLSGTATTQAATLTADWIFSAFQPATVAAVDTSNLVPLVPMLLLPTHDFRVHVVNVQAGDQLSRIRFVWERFYTTGTPTRAVPVP